MKCVCNVRAAVMWGQRPDSSCGGRQISNKNLNHTKIRGDSDCKYVSNVSVQQSVEGQLAPYEMCALRSEKELVLLQQKNVISTWQWSLATYGHEAAFCDELRLQLTVTFIIIISRRKSKTFPQQLPRAPCACLVCLTLAFSSQWQCEHADV